MIAGLRLKVALQRDGAPFEFDLSAQQIVDWFHQVHWSSPDMQKAISWLGWPLMKNPMDMWIYQRLIVEQKPDVIVEAGTFWGGSALFMAMMCDAVDHGLVVTIDVKEPPDHPKHERIEYLLGDSVSRRMLTDVKARCLGRSVMVILDSDHSRAHVAKELDLYGPLVSPGQYLIVEDTNINGHPVGPDFGPGPWEALEEWLPQHPEFERDKDCERFLLTWNPGGYLKRTNAMSTIERPKARRRRK